MNLQASVYGRWSSEHRQALQRVEDMPISSDLGLAGGVCGAYGHRTRHSLSLMKSIYKGITTKDQHACLCIAKQAKTADGLDTSSGRKSITYVDGRTPDIRCLLVLSVNEVAFTVSKDCLETVVRRARDAPCPVDALKR